MNDGGPGFVERLVPDGGCEELEVDGEVGAAWGWEGGRGLGLLFLLLLLLLLLGVMGCVVLEMRVLELLWFLFVHDGDGFGGLAADESRTALEDAFPGGRLDEVHLVDEDKDFGFTGVLDKRADDVDVGGQVALDVAALNVKHVDEHADVAEDVGSLLGEVVFHKSFLSAAVPEVQREVAKELDVG